LEGYGFWESILAFLIHLFPLTLIAALAVHWTAFLASAGIPFVIGLLYLLDWWISRQPVSPEASSI
jgi:hypothetical protein